MGRYYFVIYVTRKLGRHFFDSDVIDEHPFLWLRRPQPEANLKPVLVGWQEISEEEYELFLDGAVSEDHSDILAAQSFSLE